VNAAELLEEVSIAVHKPAGYVCSHARGQEEHQLIFDLLPVEWQKRRPLLSVAGRLDKYASGLVVLSQTGSWVYQATQRGHEREYIVETEFPIEQSVIGQFASGELMLNSETTPCLPAQLTLNSLTQASLVLQEGRYHQIRRMFEAVKNRIVSIKRVRIGGIHLADLEEGKYRKLTASEMQSVEKKQ
jgi:16S rRNA pseudouridine516 synthase